MELIVLVLIAAGACVAVGLPLFRGKAEAPRGAGIAPSLSDDAALDREVARYREALRAGTVCASCRFANPPESHFCAACGKRLPGVWE